MAKTTEQPQPQLPEGRRFAEKLVCPKSGEHRRTRVYKTAGRTRYAICDDCGATWKAISAAAQPSQDYLIQLATRLERSALSPQQVGGQAVVLITVDDARRTAQQLRNLCEAAE